MSQQAEILIIGGGLAGLVSAINLAKAGHAVLLLEKKSYPRHKVCGEYISNEVRPYLQRLGVFPENLGPKAISRFQLTAANGASAECDLGMGGFGISRYALDNFLFEKAQKMGVKVKTNCTVNQVKFLGDSFTVHSNNHGTFTAKVVIGAHGKRSLIDKALNRDFINEKTSYVGIKQHYKADFSDDLVALHNFKGGYCGLSKVENHAVNLCYLTTTDVFQRYSSIAEMQEKHLSQNPFLKEFFRIAQPTFPQPLVISQVNFSPKPLIENHILMCGDAAGMIHPLCGNGMAMAVHGAKLCAELVKEYLQGKMDRLELETTYARQWKQYFAQRLSFGRGAQRLFGRDAISRFAVRAGATFPGLLQRVVGLSHGSEVN